MVPMQGLQMLKYVSITSEREFLNMTINIEYKTVFALIVQ